MTTAKRGAVRTFAPAKINLALHVTGQRADGYHLLDSVVMFADVGDWITVEQAADLDLRVTGPMADGVPVGDDNLVLRAARLVGVTTARITLDKHLPSAAGIGGGSADAAATVRALALSHGAEFSVDALALGADVPVCLAGQSARMRGIGDQVAPLDAAPVLHAVLINPGVAVATAQVFGALTRKDGTGLEDIPSRAAASHFIAWLGTQRNDLEGPALTVAPQIGVVLSALRTQGSLLARMSGSGATCFGLFETAAQARHAARALAADQPGWWVRATCLGGPGPDGGGDQDRRATT